VIVYSVVDEVLTPEHFVRYCRFEFLYRQAHGYDFDDGSQKNDFRFGGSADCFVQLGDNVVSGGFVKRVDTVRDCRQSDDQLHCVLQSYSGIDNVIDKVSHFRLERGISLIKQLRDVGHKASSEVCDVVNLQLYSQNSGGVFAVNSSFFDISE
jgi:hypothetical protein